MGPRQIKFHVHLPVNIEKLGQPIVIGDGKELGEWEIPVVKLNRPYPNNPTYWQSEYIIILISAGTKIQYKYAISVPATLFRKNKIIYEGNFNLEDKRLLDLNVAHHFDIWINGNCPDLELYQIDKSNIFDYAFVDYIYNNINNLREVDYFLNIILSNNLLSSNLRESILEYQRLLILHKDLTISFSNYKYISKNLNTYPRNGQRLFLCFLLGYHISKEPLPYNLPADFRSDILIEALVDYRKNIFCPDTNKFITKAVLCLIQHDAFQHKFNWVRIFDIAEEIDPTYSFLESLQNLNYGYAGLQRLSKYMRMVYSSRINDITYENAVKITKWLIKFCNNIECLIEAWNNPLIRNKKFDKRILQCFIDRIQEFIFDDDAFSLANRSIELQKFQGSVSEVVKNKTLDMLINVPSKKWTDPNIHGIQKLLQDDSLNWNSDNIMVSLELISQSHDLNLLIIFPELLDDWFRRDFLDKEKKIPDISNNWFTLLLDKLNTNNENESKFVCSVFQQLDRIYPLLGHRKNIWQNLITIAADSVKKCSEHQILGAIKSVGQINEQETRKLFLDIIIEILDKTKTIQQINDQLIAKIFMICDCNSKTLEIPNTMCEDILCYIIFILQSNLPEYSPSEQHLSILKSSKFWIIILNATGSVEKLHANSYVQHAQMSIVELNRLLLEKTIDLQLLKQILEYPDEILLEHFAMLKTKAKSDMIITQDETEILRMQYDIYVNNLNKLLKFYKVFCSAPQVTDVNDYINDVQHCLQNLDKVKLKQVLEPEYWAFHEKTMDTAVHCYKFHQSQTFRNIFKFCIEDDNTATNVEYIAQKLISIVFVKLNTICKKFKAWEKVSCSEALLIWKNVRNVNAEFDLIEDLSLYYRNAKLIQTLEYLLKFPQWTERLEQLEKLVEIFQVRYNESDLLPKSIHMIKDDSLLLDKVIQFVEDLELNFSNNQDYWNLVKELSNAEDFICFLRKISEYDIKHLIDILDDYPDERLIQEITILSLIQIKQLLLPLIKEHGGHTITDFLEELQTITKKDSTLAGKISLCDSSKMVLRNMYYNILNHDQDTNEKIKNAILNGTYIFVCDEKKDKCFVKLKCNKDIYNLNEILDLRRKTLLIAKSKALDNMNNFIELVDVAQEIINNMTILMQRRHFSYQRYEKKLKEIENMKEFLIFIKDNLGNWENIMNQAQRNRYYLTFFTARQFFAFYDYFTSEKLDKENEEICKILVRFVNSNAQLPSHKDTKVILSESKDYPEIFYQISNELENIFRNVQKQRRKLEIIQREDNVKKDRLFVGTYNDKLLVPNIIMSLYANNRYYPEPWQLLICTTSTTMEELIIFINRCFFASDNGYNNYLFCIVNLELLDFEWQYSLINYIKETQLEYKNENYLLALLCYRELGVSQYILDQHSFKVREINGLDTEMMQEIYQELCPNVLCVSSDLSGQGKTEWIKEASFSKHKIPHSFLISDGMSLEYLVNKLKVCKLKHTESLHINILSIDYPENINLFLFELLTLRIVSYNDIIVSIPETFIYIEIASSVKQQLLNSLPILKVLPFKHLSWNIEHLKVSQEITSPIQVVCHYLNLYDYAEIDTQEIFFNTSNAFPLSFELCQNLINKYFLSKNDKNILSFRYIEIFANVLANQLIRLSSNQYFTINNIKLNLKETNNIRATMIKLLIEVSNEFARKSIKTKVEQFESLVSEDKSTNSDIITQWENSNHNIMFFNSQVSDSFTILYHDKCIVPDNIKLLLKSQVIGDSKSWEMDDYNTMSANELLTTLERMTHRSTQELSTLGYVLSSDNLIKMALILLRVRANIPVVICGEAGCGKTSLIAHLALVMEVQFQLLNLYSGIEEETIIIFISEALKKSEKGEIWILFDEINTCNYLGILADLISNRNFQNRPIHLNIRLFATCNPYRFHTQSEATNIEKFKEQSDLVYLTRPLPDQILDYVWNYGVLNQQVEYKYIQIMVDNELKELAHPIFSELLFISQQFIRKFERPYSVSLRDVKRAIILVKFFHNSFKNRPAYKNGHKYPLPEGPTTITRSYVLSLSLCYHSRLCKHDLRKQYNNEIEQILQKVEIGENMFSRIIREEQEDYIDRMQIPSSVAKNETLLENVLAMIVCILTKIPVFIVGETGSSKSLAIHLISSNLCGPDSSDDYFKTLPKIRVIQYLGSSRSTLDEVFEKANNFQETNSKPIPIISVILIDNVGLIVKNPSNRLKILHSLLEPNCSVTESAISFIGISNWRLDIGKCSRALLVQRPQIDLDDLVNSTENLLSTKFTELNQEESSKLLARAYFDYNKEFPRIHGLRDYYALVKWLSLNEITSENIQMALARNFGGIENNSELWKKYFGNIIQIFNNNNSWPYNPIPIVQLIESNLDDPNARNLMVIGKSESVVSLLTDQLKKRNMDPVVILGSQFSNDQDDYSRDVLSRIMTCIRTGRPVILADLDMIYVKLYDLWNQNYIVAENKENTPQVTIEVHTNSILHISLKFECILVMDEKNIHSADPSLLNRFEKQKLSINDALNERQQSFVQELEDWTRKMSTFENDQYRFTQKDLFIGFDEDETLQSLVYSTTKNNLDTDDKILEECKKRLIGVATLDGIIRAKQSDLEPNEINQWKNIYLCQQHHDSLYDYFEALFNQENLVRNLIVNTFSIINMDIKSCLNDLVRCQVYRLSNFKNEAQLSKMVENFFIKSTDQMLILQCDISVDNLKCINLAKFIIEQFQSEILDKKEEPEINIHIKYVCIIYHIQRNCEQNLILPNFMCGWEQITIESLEQQNIPLNNLLDKSLYDIVNSDLFSQIIGSSMPFEKILKDELLWCLSCIKYQISNEGYNNYVSMLSKKILNNANFIECIKTKTFEWIFENCKDWQFEIARNKDYLNKFTCFSLALQDYIKLIIKQTIAKILYSLEKLSATTTFFNIENNEYKIRTELFNLWKQFFMDNTIISLNNLPEAKPSSYLLSCSMINELEFPFSYYFINQINFYETHYYEELDILRQDLDNINMNTKELELHNELIEDHIEDFKNNLLSVNLIFENLQKYSESYYNDFIKILSSSHANSKKELDTVLRHLNGDKIVDDPFLLHIYWWKYSDNILIQLQLIENFPSITTKVQEDFIVHGKLDRHLYKEAINLVLQKICNNEEWEQNMEVILSLVDKMNDTKNLANLSLLLICNDLLKINLIPLEKIKEMIDLGRSAKKQEFITVEIIELVFDYLDNDDNLTSIRSFITRCLEIIPLESEVRLIFYKKLFSRNPFKLIIVIIEKIFTIENQEKDGIFLTLIINPEQALQHSIRLSIINDCLDVKKSDSNMEEFCCEVIQAIFNEFEFKKAITYFKHTVEIFTKMGDSALQHITVIAFLKEFTYKFWKCILEDNSLPESLIKEINDCFSIKHPHIRSFKYNLLLQRKDFLICENQFKTLKNIFPWIEDKVEEEIVYLPKFWRPIRKVKFEDLHNFYNSHLIKTVDKYLFLSVYFNQHEKLKLIRHLCPIVRFVKFLNSKNEYNLTKTSAQTMTFNEFIAKESIGDTANDDYLKNLFKEFALGWNSVINYIIQYQSKELPSNKPFMNIECPVIFGLVEQKDSGIYLCAILEFLIKLQNEFLDNVLAIPIGQCKSFRPIETWNNINSKAYFVKSIKLAQAQYTNFIDYEWNEKIILRHSQRNLEQGGNTNFIFDLQQIETILVKELVYNKVYFEKEDNQFYLKDFSFKHELFHNSSRILFDIKTILSQEPIPKDKIGIVLTYLLESPDDSDNLLFLFEIILSFIKELSINNNDMLVINFIALWSKLKRLDTSNYEKIFDEYSLKHIIELYERIEKHVAGSIIQHSVIDKFKIPLTQQMKESISNCTNYYDQEDQNQQLISAEEFVLALKRFIYRFLLIDSNMESFNLNVYFLDFTLDLWPSNIEKELIENWFPTCLFVPHAYDCYNFISDEIKKVKREKPNKKSRAK